MSTTHCDNNHGSYRSSQSLTPDQRVAPPRSDAPCLDGLPPASQVHCISAGAHRRDVPDITASPHASAHPGSDKEVDRLLSVKSHALRSQSAAGAAHICPFEESDGEEEFTPLFTSHVPSHLALGLQPVQPKLSQRLPCSGEDAEAEGALCYSSTAIHTITRRTVMVRTFTVAFDKTQRAPRFISVHSIRRKELERDYCPPPDSRETCPTGKHCQGRCVLGFACPTPDKESP
ncbi:hypothetical protein ACQY0O_004456 [Thecaphora frezii]